MATILIVDDEIGIRELLSEILSDEGHDVRTAASAQVARDLRARERPDLVLLDIWMPDVDGISLLKDWAAGGQLTMPVVMMSGHASIDSAVEATRIGAIDFLEKPIALQKLLATVKRALARPAVQVGSGLTLDSLGRSGRMLDLRKRLQPLALVQSPVLLRGESGTHAEIYARALQPPGAAFVNVTGQLAEAPQEALGRVGIVFVDDLIALSRAQQRGLALLLSRVDRAVQRLICFASADPQRLASEGALDAAALARLAEVILVVPALREQPEDNPDIAVLLLAQLVEARSAPPRRFTTAALNRLRNYAWPRNLEQLQQAVRSLALTALDDEIGAADVERILKQYDAPMPSPSTASPAPLAPTEFDQPLREARDAFERAYFAHLLAAENGSMSRVAERSGMERTHLYRKLRQLGIGPSRKEDREE